MRFNGVMPRIRLDLAYDGTFFSGWAAQPGLRTVQGEIEAALAMASREDIVTTVAGRTDAGVHARHQVCHLDVSDEAWARLAPQGRGERGRGHGLVHRAQAQQDPLGALR